MWTIDMWLLCRYINQNQYNVYMVRLFVELVHIYSLKFTIENSLSHLCGAWSKNQLSQEARLAWYVWMYNLNTSKTMPMGGTQYTVHQSKELLESHGFGGPHGALYSRSWTMAFKICFVPYSLEVINWHSTQFSQWFQLNRCPPE